MKDYDYNDYVWYDEDTEINHIKCDNPDIYKLSIKELNQLIINKLDLIIRLLSNVLEK